MVKFEHHMAGEIRAQSDEGAGISGLSLGDNTVPKRPTLDHKNLYDGVS